MKTRSIFLVILSVLIPLSVLYAEMKFHSLEANLINGNPFPFEQLKGKTVLVVNTASKCGFTPQYEGLQRLYDKYKSKNFTILGFPSNQFGSQEPGSNEEIASFCKLNFGVKFPMFEKGKVKGEEIQPVYQYLLNELPGEKIGWNFEKILVGPDGKVLRKFKSSVEPNSSELKSAIEATLG